MKQDKLLSHSVWFGIALLCCAAESFAAVTWSFNWYCSGCARIGARTSGTNGPFGSREACESARSSMQSTMNSRGGGVNTVSCQSAGVDMPAPQPSTPAPRSGYGGGGYQAPQQQYQQPGVDYEQQRRAEEERRRQEEEARQAEAERKRRQEFAKSREDALRLLKGAESGELGLKGLDQGSELQLKGLDTATPRDVPSVSNSRVSERCPPNADPSVVNLCDRDPNKPLVVDTGVMKRKSQLSGKALSNESYIKGFDAIRAGDHALAVQYFKKTQAQLGNHTLVRNALALAQDLVRVHKQDARNNPAAQEAYKAFLASYDGNHDQARQYLEAAIRLDPNDTALRDKEAFIQGLRLGTQVDAEKARHASALESEMIYKDKAYQSAHMQASRLAQQSLVPIFLKSDWMTAVMILDAALNIEPGNRAIANMLADAERVAGRIEREGTRQSKKK